MKLDSVPEKTETYFPSKLPKSFLLVDQIFEKQGMYNITKKFLGSMELDWACPDATLQQLSDTRELGRKMLNHDLYHR